MKKILLVLIAVITLAFILALFGQEFTYEGSSKCKICHKTEKQGQQYLVWEESKHSQSFSALNSEEAAQIAKEAGIQTPPADSPKCLNCHGPLFEKAPDLKEESVTCEVCHGPGSHYKKLSIMKSREESVKNGLIVYDSPEAIKSQCLSCHANAHGKTFDFSSSWEKIKHPKPEDD